MDKSTVVRKLASMGIRQWRLQTAIDKYQEGSVTLLKAARIGGLSTYEKIGVLEEKRIPCRYDISDLEEHMKKDYG